MMIYEESLWYENTHHYEKLLKTNEDACLNIYTDQWIWDTRLTLQALKSEIDFPDTSTHPSIEVLDTCGAN